MYKALGVNLVMLVTRTMCRRKAALKANYATDADYEEFLQLFVTNRNRKAILAEGNTRILLTRISIIITK